MGGSGEGRDVLDHVVGPDHAIASGNLRGRRVTYGVTFAVLALLMALALLDAIGVFPSYGVDTAHARNEGGGYELDVYYGEVSRPALATPFEIVVRRSGGFDEPITVAIDHDYMKLFDENGFYPTPSAETTMGEWLVYEFDPPEGDALQFSYDARIEPGAQSGRSGHVAVLEDTTPVVEVSFSTRVLP